ncbi:MAG: cystathionine beta-synthase [Proteobacteria bacterium]|nr:MAG: cystathionine beta-synthase [Pseudomonadota bacterium]
MLNETILEAIGRTPLVRLHRVSAGLECNLFAKCEFLNPGGSVKDRIAYEMVVDAEKSGRIKPGDTLIEPTSGNTGIGLALAGAVKGYRVIITMPEKMSREKQVVLEALGAEIIRTPTEAAWDAPDSHISVAKRLQKELPNAHILDQYGNPSNPKAHEDKTAQEMLDDLGGKIDMAVIAAGTGGTITGIARKLKAVNPNCIIVGADPEGSILAGGSDVFSYKVEGIGYDFIPDVLDRKLIDTWVKTNDRQSFLLARRLIREEGLLCGGSSGSALMAALKEAKRLKKGQNCVVIFADGVRNYMTKFIDDKWMVDNEFVGPDSMKGTVETLLVNKPKRNLITISSEESAQKAIELMRNQGISQLPVLNQEGHLVGLLTEDNLIRGLSSTLDSSAPIRSLMERSVPTVEFNTPVSSLQGTILKSGLAIVLDAKKQPSHILTKIDLVEFMSSKK